MMLTVMTALSVLFLSSLTVSLCDLCKTVIGGLMLWVIIIASSLLKTQCTCMT